MYLSAFVYIHTGAYTSSGYIATAIVSLDNEAVIDYRN